MKRRKYPESFERLWKSFDTDYGEKGSKIKALEVFIKMEINPDDVEFIIENYTQQRMAKELQRIRGEFSANFQHVERYLNNERFDDEISLNTYQQQQLTKSEKSDSALRQYITRDDGEGMEDITSNGKDPSRGRVN
jgi:hypothetical protein|tara:strand:- start:2880 stop:3287 length:408 start_codon:yes stop_codon:yes gene_type:complete